MLGVAIGCSGEQARDRILGRIGDYELTEEHFQAAFRLTYLRTGSAMPVNSVSRKAIFDREFNQFVLAVHAQDVGLDKAEASSIEKGILERKILTEEYLKAVLLDTLKPDPKLSRELFRRSKTYLRASHLFTESKEVADSLYAIVSKQPERFGELAKSVFKNPVLASNGGDVGLFTVDDMDMAFEEKAYRMNVGEISKPVKTDYGYSIIRLDAAYPEPIITETQYLSAQPVFDQLAEKRLGFMVKDLHMEDVLGSYSMNYEVIERLWIEFEQNDRFKANAERLKGAASSPEVKVVLADSELGAFTVGDYYRELYFTPALTRGKISSKTRFQEMIKGLVYRDYTVKEGRKRGLHKTYRFKKQVEYAFAAYLDGRVEEEIRKMTEITPYEIEQAFLTVNKEEFAVPEQLRLSRLVLDSKDKALEVARKIRAGLPFEEAVRRYSLDVELQPLAGDLGLVSVRDLGMMAPKLKEVKEGQISEPIEYQTNRFHIYKVWQRIPTRAMTESEAAEAMREMLFEERVKTNKAKLIAETRQNRKAMVDSARLNETKLEL